MSFLFDDCFAAFGVAAGGQLGTDRPFDELMRRGAGRLEARVGLDPDFGHRLRRGAAAREPWRDLSGVSDDELRRRVIEDIDGGRLALRMRWRQSYGPGNGAGDGSTDPLETGIEELAEKHFVGFLALDGNGDPYPGLEYVICGPNDEREEGSFDDAGEVRKDDVYEADYTLTLRELADVAWSESGARAEIPVTLRAAAPGYEDGTAVEVRLFREFAETDDDVLETLSGEVVDAAIQLEWCYQHERNGPFKRTTGVVPIVAEVRIDATGAWAKSIVPLQLQLPTVDQPLWSAKKVGSADAVTLSVRVLGAPDGTPITIEVFSRHSDGTEQSLDAYEEAVQDQALSLQWTYSGDAEAEAECFFIATLDGDDARVAVSPSLWVSRRARKSA